MTKTDYQNIWSKLRILRDLMQEGVDYKVNNYQLITTDGIDRWMARAWRKESPATHPTDRYQSWNELLPLLNIIYKQVKP